MVLQILMGSGLVLVTTAIHGACTVELLAAVRQDRVDRSARRSRATRMLLVSGVAFLLFLAAVLEATIWAAVYRAVDAVPSFDTALYFSIVSS